MRWLKWILANLFDCVHSHTTWPHRDRAGLAYICCVDCGRELPYSLRRMRIVTREEREEDKQYEVTTVLHPAGGACIQVRQERLLA
jgi:hypothetical protein